MKYEWMHICLGHVYIKDFFLWRPLRQYESSLVHRLPMIGGNGIELIDAVLVSIEVGPRRVDSARRSGPVTILGAENGQGSTYAEFIFVWLRSDDVRFLMILVHLVVVVILVGDDAVHLLHALELTGFAPLLRRGVPQVRPVEVRVHVTAALLLNVQTGILHHSFLGSRILIHALLHFHRLHLDRLLRLHDLSLHLFDFQLRKLTSHLRHTANLPLFASEKWGHWLFDARLLREEPILLGLKRFALHDADGLLEALGRRWLLLCGLLLLQQSQDVEVLLIQKDSFFLEVFIDNLFLLSDWFTSPIDFQQHRLHQICLALR
jgi:hypothetical protein